jgi:hypothetical protein
VSGNDTDVEQCLAALRASTLPNIRAREERLFAKASKAVDEALAHHSHLLQNKVRWLLDACRAATLLVTYLYNTGQYPAVRAHDSNMGCIANITH